jgi:hypothetical protein
MQRKTHTVGCEVRLREYGNAKRGIQSVVVQETIAVEATINGGERESGWQTRRPHAKSAQGIKCRQDLTLCA